MAEFTDSEVSLNQSGVGVTIPLHATTWDLDREEGVEINNMKATHIEPFTNDSIQVAPDFERNIIVTSVDALLNWSRKSSVFPMTFLYVRFSHYFPAFPRSSEIARIFLCVRSFCTLGHYFSFFLTVPWPLDSRYPIGGGIRPRVGYTIRQRVADLQLWRHGTLQKRLEHFGSLCVWLHSRCPNIQNAGQPLV